MATAVTRAWLGSLGLYLCLACGDGVFTQTCSTDSDCSGDALCINQRCVAASGPRKAAGGDGAVVMHPSDAGSAVDAGSVDAMISTDARPGQDQAATPDASAVLDRAAAQDSQASDAATTSPDATSNGCGDDQDCPSGLCDHSSGDCELVECLYDEHCDGYTDHCSASHRCVTGHNCDSGLAYIPYPWGDSMSISVEGDSSDSEQVYSPTGSCGDADGPEDIYRFDLPRAVKRLTITMSALPTPDAWDTHLYVAASVCGATNLGCRDLAVGAQPEILVLSDLAAGTITVVADGYYDGSAGPYRLSVTVDECDAAVDCSGGEVCVDAATEHSRCESG